MLGIIAAIIAVKKGHKDFALGMIAWVVIAIIISFSGHSTYAFGPGMLFLVIAIKMKKIPPAEVSEEANSDALQGSHKDGFICTACNERSTGWYQVCPKCNASGTMTPYIAPANEAEQAETASVDTNANSPQLPLPDSGIEASTEPALPYKYCRICGAELIPGAHFCSECGTEIFSSDMEVPLSPASSENAPSNSEATNQVDSQGGSLPVVQESSSDSDNSAPVPSIDLSTLPPLLRRAFILTEDEEWEAARAYFDKVLDDEPENAYAYLGKALIEIKVDSIEDLTDSEKQNICETKPYKRALKYASGPLHDLLLSWKKI